MAREVITMARGLLSIRGEDSKVCRLKSTQHVDLVALWHAGSQFPDQELNLCPGTDRWILNCWPLGKSLSYTSDSCQCQGPLTPISGHVWDIPMPHGPSWRGKTSCLSPRHKPPNENKISQFPPKQKPWCLLTWLSFGSMGVICSLNN